MFDITLNRTHRAVRAAATARVMSSSRTTSSVKRSVLAMSMRFSYDATPERDITC